MKEKEITILAIESSCDETAAAVVRGGREILSNVISSQIELHKLYGGVVPEIASRKHIEKINQVIEEALKEAELEIPTVIRMYRKLTEKKILSDKEEPPRTWEELESRLT